MAAAPRDDRSTDSLVDAANSMADVVFGRTPATPRPASRPLPGLLGILASLVTAPPPSTGPCFDKPETGRRRP